MSISDAYKHNFDTLQRAFQNGDVALLECTDKITGDPVFVLCAMQADDEVEGAYIMMPFAKLFDGDPYDELDPPSNVEDLSKPPTLN